MLEPLALGLLVAPSWAGGALAVSALAGFFARRPVRATLQADPGARRAAARGAVAALAFLAVAGLAEAGVLAGWVQLWPLLPAALLGVWFAACDAAGESRSSSAELAGGALGALLAAAVVTAAGAGPVPALLVAGLVLARSIPVILTVRAYVRDRKGGRGASFPALLAAGVAVLALAAGVALRLLPVVAVALGGLWLARTSWLLGPWRPDWPARRIGLFEAVLGLASVLALGLSFEIPNLPVP